jgi:hypothetical protein
MKWRSTVVSRFAVYSGTRSETRPTFDKPSQATEKIEHALHRYNTVATNGLSLTGLQAPPCTRENMHFLGMRGIRACNRLQSQDYGEGSRSFTAPSGFLILR